MFRILLLTCLIRLTFQQETTAIFKTDYFNQLIDHFNFKINGTFKQRFLFTEQYWNKKGPIFFYSGNEGNIEAFQKASGFLTDHAVKANAFVVFAEHRYYGESLPFGNHSFTGNNIGFLSVDQALTDYATLIKYLKKMFNAENSKVISFGGSYGGMLSAYMRFKYPNLVDGAFAASAPLSWVSGHGDRHGFFKSVTEQFAKSSQMCVDLVKQGFLITKILAEQGNYDKISSTFRTCNIVNASSLNHLYGWLRNSFTILAMMNYPYPASLFGPLPGHPVDAACHAIINASDPMVGIANAAAIVYQGLKPTGDQKCFDIYKLYIECADPTGCGLDNDALAWDYQACTDIILPGGSTNVTDMFPKLPFTLEMRTAYCQKKHGITPQNEWPDTEWWGEKIQTAKNIIYSNGDLDPWGDGGVHTGFPGVYVVAIKTGAHHYDLRGSNPKDTSEIIAVREKEFSIIQGWINA